MSIIPDIYYCTSWMEARVVTRQISESHGPGRVLVLRGYSKLRVHAAQKIKVIMRYHLPQDYSVGVVNNAAPTSTLILRI